MLKVSRDGSRGAPAIRYVVKKSGEPTVAEIEAGTVSTKTNGTIQDVTSLGIDGDGNLEEAWIGVAAYKGAQGKGPDGATDHDDVQVQKVGGRGVGSEKITPATNPNLTSSDPDTSALTGVDVTWDPFTLKVADFEIDIPGGTKSGLEGQTTYYLYWDTETATVEVVKIANIKEKVGFKRLPWGTITTVEDLGDGSSSGSSDGTSYGEQF